MAVVAQGELELRLSKQSASNIEKDIEKAAKSSSGPGGKAGQEFGSAFEKKFGPALSHIGNDLKKFGQSGGAGFNALQALESGAGNAATALESVGPVGIAAGGAIAGLAAFAVRGANEFVHLAGEVRQFSLVSGASAEDSSKLVVALDELGVSSEQVARGLFRLSRAALDGNEPLKEFGVSIVRTKTGGIDTLGTLNEIADAIHNSGDASFRNALAFKAFGRAGLELLPILSRGSAELKEFTHIAELRGEVFSAKDLEAARQYQISLRSLSGAFQGVEIAVGRHVIGPITNFTNNVTGLIDEVDHLAQVGGKSRIAGVLGGIGETIASAVPGASFFFAADKTKQKLDELGAAEQKFADTVKKDSDALKSGADAISLFESQVSESVLLKGGQFGPAATGAAISLATDLKTGVTDYTKALQMLDPTAARVAQDQEKIALGLDPIAAKFDLAAAAADQFNTAVGYTLGVVLDLDKATLGVGRAEEAVTKTLKDTKASLLDRRDATIRLVESIQQEEAAKIKESDGLITAGQARQNFLRDIDAEIAKYPALRDELSRYRAEIEKTPDSKLIDFRAEGIGGVQGSIDTLNATLKTLVAIFEKKYHLDVDTTSAVFNIDGLKQHIGELPPGASSFIGFIPGRVPVSTSSAGGSRGRAGGGPVLAGHPYMVGEQHAEWFVPNEDGYVYPQAQRPDATQRPKGNGAMFGDINVYEVQGDREATAFAVMSRIAAALNP